MPSNASLIRYSIRLALILLIAALLTACSSRQLQDSLVGSTAQRLVSYSIDDLARELPDRDFAPFAGKRLHLETHFVEYSALKAYADRRLALELATRFDIEVVASDEPADGQLTVFYTSLGTDQGQQGFYLPLGFVPGVSETAQINLITLEQFHGVAEMYYYLGNPGHELRSEVIQARTRTDALGLPIITIPISTIDRR